MSHMMALGPRKVAPELLNKVTKALGITELEQWHYISHHAASQVIGARALKAFGGSVTSFIKSAYPNHHFDEEKLSSRRQIEKDQKFLEVIIRKLFPNTEIYTKARKAVGIVNPETDAYLEIDFWIPSLKLGIEYQDKHHFTFQWYTNQSVEDYKKRDNYKKDTMSKLGYTLIAIGFWWDKTIESLAATIRKFRPDLLQEFEDNTAEPISSEPPDIAPAAGIPGIAGIMSPFVPSYNFNPTNWYAGEKHDGIRGVYNPESTKMFSRSGKELSLLPALLQDIPNKIVDGEIIAGRGNYSNTSVVSFHTHHDKVYWPIFRYVIFDIPDSSLGNYTQRYSILLSALSFAQFIFTQLAFRVLISDKAHLKMLVDTIISDSGEGVIVQQDAPYEYGRAKSLAKIKLRRDADAKVMRVNKSSCSCKLASGISTDIVYCTGFEPSELKVGDVVSFYHTGYTISGVPKQAEIYRIRYDIPWAKLVSDANQNVAKQRSVKETIGRYSLTAQNVARQRSGYWNKSRNVRAFLDDFARKVGFDPLVPENWYPITARHIRNAGGTGMYYAYSYSFKKALESAYPEVKFEYEKFRTKDTSRVRNKFGHWDNTSNVQAFFDEFAAAEGFDPRVPRNWYLIRHDGLRRAGGGGLINAYGSLMKALQSAYPKLKFEAKKFRTRVIGEASFKQFLVPS